MTAPCNQKTLDEYGHAADGGRACAWWRCGDDCFGLPRCEHPERTPFYLKPLPQLPPHTQGDAPRA